MKRTHTEHFLLCVIAAMAAGAAGASTVSYSYDSLGRLITASYPDGSCTGYQYDAAGNRTQYTSSGTAAPTAGTVNISTYQDIASSLDPRVNAMSCAALTITAVGAAGHGTTTIVSGGTGVTYAPNGGYTGPDSFTYTISNGQTATAGVTVTVNAPTLPPVATGGLWSAVFYITVPNKVKPIVTQSVSAIATSPYGYPLTVSAVTQAAHGAVTFTGQNITYTYASMVGGNKEIGDGFTYTVSDGHGHASSAAVVVNITVSTNQ